MKHNRWLAFKIWAGLAQRGRKVAPKPEEAPPNGGRLFRQSVGGSVGSSGGIQ